MARLFRLLLLSLTLTNFSWCQRTAGAGATVLSDKQTLTGRKAVVVSIDVASMGNHDFQAEIETILRQGGINTLPASQQRSLVYPLLRLTVEATVVQRIQQLNYCATLDFIQYFQLPDNRYVKATTWSSSHHGLAPWNGPLSVEPTVAEVEKQVHELLAGFVSDWRDVNVAGGTRTVSGRFDGVWQGSYSCAGGFGGGGTSQWTISEVSPGEVEVQEQWNHFISGHNTYTGKISGNNLNVKTRDMGGYEVKLVLSSDGLNGVYIGHPNQCQTITLRKVR